MTDAKTLQLELDQLPDPLAIPAWTRSRGRAPLDLTIRPPGSKSLTNRALLLAAMAPGTSSIHHPLLDADDARRMISAVEALGARVEHGDAKLRITGVVGPWTAPAGTTIDLHHSGTATRFITGAAALAGGPITITGSARIQQRPIDELTDALAQLGCSIESHGTPGCPPITVTPAAIPPTEHPVIEIGKTRSSQYISALLLIGTRLASGITLRLTGEITSASYIRMTLDQLDSIGVRVQATDDLSVLRVHPGLQPFSVDIEPDASTATYWWAAGALLPEATVRVEGIGVPGTDSALRPSLQGDARFPDLLEQMGCTITTRTDRAGAGTASTSCRAHGALRGILCDMSSMPDAVMTLAAVASFARGTTVIRGVRTLRDKECDRVRALVTELARIGVRVEEDLGGDPDSLSITPPEGGVDTRRGVEPVVFETYDDHRIAMAMALIALRRPNCSIVDPACVAKSEGGFWKTLARFYE